MIATLATPDRLRRATPQGSEVGAMATRKEPEPFQRNGKSGWWFYYYDEWNARRLKRGGNTVGDCWRAIHALDAELALVRLGVVQPEQLDYARAGKKRLPVLLAEFRQHLHGRRASEQHIATTVADVKTIAAKCSIRSLAGFTITKVDGFLGDVLASGLSVNRRNRHRASLVQFLNWAVKTGKIPTNPITAIEALNEDVDRRRIRRALSIKELWALIDTTAAVGEKGGPIRALYYHVAARAGLRFSEIHRLRPKDCELDTADPCLLIPAEITKTGRDAILSIDPDLATALRKRLDHLTSRTELIFPTMPTLITWKKDLLRARRAWILEPAALTARVARARTDFLKYETPEGYAYRGALRTTFGTHMYQMGVDLRTAQERMRHSDINLTAKIYQRVRLKDQRVAADLLRRETTDETPANEGRKIG